MFRRVNCSHAGQLTGTHSPLVRGSTIATSRRHVFRGTTILSATTTTTTDTSPPPEDNKNGGQNTTATSPSYNLPVRSKRPLRPYLAHAQYLPLASASYRSMAELEAALAAWVLPLPPHTTHSRQRWAPAGFNRALALASLQDITPFSTKGKKTVHTQDNDEAVPQDESFTPDEWLPIDLNADVRNFSPTSPTTTAMQAAAQSAVVAPCEHLIAPDRAQWLQRAAEDRRLAENYDVVEASQSTVWAALEAAMTSLATGPLLRPPTASTSSTTGAKKGKKLHNKEGRQTSVKEREAERATEGVEGAVTITWLVFALGPTTHGAAAETVARDVVRRLVQTSGLRQEQDERGCRGHHHVVMPIVCGTPHMAPQSNLLDRSPLDTAEDRSTSNGNVSKNNMDDPKKATIPLIVFPHTRLYTAQTVISALLHLPRWTPEQRPSAGENTTTSNNTMDKTSSSSSSSSSSNTTSGSTSGGPYAPVHQQIVVLSNAYAATYSMITQTVEDFKCRLLAKGEKEDTPCTTDAASVHIMRSFPRVHQLPILFQNGRGGGGIGITGFDPRTTAVDAGRLEAGMMASEVAAVGPYVAEYIRVAASIDLKNIFH